MKWIVFCSCPVNPAVITLQVMNNCLCNRFSSQIRDRAEAVERMRHLREIAAALDRRWVDSSKWMAVALCPTCGQLWAEEAAPFGEMHGGGPDCYYQIETDNPADWLRDAERSVSGLL